MLRAKRTQVLKQAPYALLVVFSPFMVMIGYDYFTKAMSLLQAGSLGCIPGFVLSVMSLGIAIVCALPLAGLVQEIFKYRSLRRRP